MNVLVACEESQVVCKAFLKMGHNAFSCDIQPCSGGRPDRHIHGDCLKILNGNCKITLQDNHTEEIVGRWDLIIAHPECTHLANSGARHFEKKRTDGRQRSAIEFFCKFLTVDCDRVAIENPVGIISGNYIKEWFPDLCEKYGLPIKPTQIIQPYEFGDPHKKTTCLWLKNLPPLHPTKIVEPNLISYKCKNGKIATFDESYCRGFNGDRAKSRSKTFQGIAEAMAEQWSDIPQNVCYC